MADEFWKSPLPPITRDDITIKDSSETRRCYLSTRDKGIEEILVHSKGIGATLITFSCRIHRMDGCVHIDIPLNVGYPPKSLNLSVVIPLTQLENDIQYDPSKDDSADVVEPVVTADQL